MRGPARFRTIAAAAVLALTTVTAGAAPSTAGDMTGPPAAPANLRATDVRPDSIAVAWDAVPHATEYRVTVVPLEAGAGFPFPTPSVTISGLTAQLTNLTWDVPYNIHVRAFAAGFYPNRLSAATSIRVTTPLPDDYEPPGAPTNLRVEHDATGQAEVIRWDPPAQGSAGPFFYWVFLDNPMTTGLLTQQYATSIRVEDTPIAGLGEPGAQSTVRIVASDRISTLSPPAAPLVLTCCTR